MFENYTDIMSAHDVASEMHVSRNRVYDLLSTGQLRGYREGHTWKIPKLALIDYVMERSQTPHEAFDAYR